MDAATTAQTELVTHLPFSLTLEDGSVVRVSSLATVANHTTLKLEFDLCVVFVSVRSDSPATYGLLVPILRRAIASLRLAVSAIVDQAEDGSAQQ